MFLIRRDVKNNRLYITLTGVILYSDAVKMKEQLVKEVEGLQPGFDTISDISKFIRGDETAAPILQWAVKYLVEKKVNRIVRVIGTSRAGLMIFAKYAQPDEKTIIKYVPTLKEAEKYLKE